MSKNPQKLTATDQRPEAAATRALETVKTTITGGSSSKSAWNLTKIQALNRESLK